MKNTSLKIIKFSLTNLVYFKKLTNIWKILFYNRILDNLGIFDGKILKAQITSRIFGSQKGSIFNASIKVGKTAWKFVGFESFFIKIDKARKQIL